MTFGALALLAILLLLQASFGSFRLAVLSFLLLPMDLVGGVLAVWLGDGILMISHVQRLEQEEGVPFGPELVLRALAHRRQHPRP